MASSAHSAKSSFYKYQGAGNDFILIDDRACTFPADNLALISRLCHRQYGIGADGLILLQHHATADFAMCIFNCDGHEASMCGNGLRCLGRFLLDLGFPQKHYSIVTKGGTWQIDAQEQAISINIESPRSIIWNHKWGHFLDTGVPHVVVFSEDRSSFEEMGRVIRHHADFQPGGTNVTFVTPHAPHHVVTYERGVEGLTLACGTGAIAAALALAYEYNQAPPISLITHSKEQLIVAFSRSDQEFSDIWLTGPAQHIFSGQIICDSLN